MSLPFSPLPILAPTGENVPDGLRNSPDVLMVAFLFIVNSIQQRASGNPKKGNLKSCDFIGYHNERDCNDSDLVDLMPAGSAGFLDLCDLAVKYDMKLFNVNPSWFQVRDEYPERSSPDLGIPIVSLICVNSYVFPMKMPNLEKIAIRATSKSNIGPNWRQERPDWTALKHLDITVDSKEKIHFENYGRAPYNLKTDAIFQFFFQGIQREALAELHLRFSTAGEVAIPKTEEIVASCPNLRNLTLINWPGTNKALTKFWGGLPGLEEISLEGCKNLGNVAFVGEDKSDPILLKLTKLRKLTLKSLDKMPKITDTLFSLVLRHMKLSKLTITSCSPVESVTSKGILSLLEGKFAESIEKFPFQNWSLAGVSPAEFQKMEEKFRSHDML